MLHVSTFDGETIDTTTNHPFYVEDRGWVAAGDLEIGDTLVTAKGDEVEVTDLVLEKLAEPTTVYNLEVEDFHTYFVGEYGVLVHNSYITDKDLFAVGKKSSPPSGRAVDFGLNKDVSLDTLINDLMKPNGNSFEHGGASTFETINELVSKVKGVVYKLPKGTVLPDELSVCVDVVGGHNTIYTTTQMMLKEFLGLIRNLPWKKV